MDKIAVIALISSAINGQAYAAGLLGKRVSTQYFYQSTDTVYTQPSYTTVDGIKTTSFNNNFDMLLKEDSVEISFLGSASWNSASFNGFKILNVDGTIDNFAPSIASSNMVGLSKSNIRFDNNAIWVNWQGLAFDTGTKVKLNLFSSAVPEPETWALMLTGLTLTGASLRRSARSAVSRPVVA